MREIDLFHFTSLWYGYWPFFHLIGKYNVMLIRIDLQLFLSTFYTQVSKLYWCKLYDIFKTDLPNEFYEFLYIHVDEISAFGFGRNPCRHFRTQTVMNTISTTHWVLQMWMEMLDVNTHRQQHIPSPKYIGQESIFNFQTVTDFTKFSFNALLLWCSAECLLRNSLHFLLWLPFFCYDVTSCFFAEYLIYDVNVVCWFFDLESVFLTQLNWKSLKKFGKSPQNCFCRSNFKRSKMEMLGSDSQATKNRTEKYFPFQNLSIFSMRPAGKFGKHNQEQKYWWHTKI